MATFPLRVEEGSGETFMLERQGPAPTKERLEMGDKVQTGCGPPIHRHVRQVLSDHVHPDGRVHLL